jgi:hypothetical protein
VAICILYFSNKYRRLNMISIHMEIS